MSAGGAVLALLVLALAAAPAARAAPVVVDDFEDVSAWKAVPADGVALTIGRGAGVKGGALQLDFDFKGGGGYAVARRAVSLDLPANYRFRFAVRGECLPNDLEFKLIDASGENVWWCNRRSFEFAPAWQRLTTKKRQIEFAWGPSPGELKHVAAIEIAVTAGRGGTGTVWLDELTLEALPVPPAAPPAPRATATSAAGVHGATRAIDGDPSTQWASGPGDAHPSLTLDLGMDREFGGVIIDWAPSRPAPDYALETSDSAGAWTVVREVRGGNGGRDAHYLPETEARRLRIRVLGALPRGGTAVREVRLEPLAATKAYDDFLRTLVRGAPRGTYPRMYLEQSYWTVVGIDGDADEALLDEDGRLETGKARFSIEPFLRESGRLWTWTDVTTEQSLERGALPIPSTTWHAGLLELTVTAFALDSGIAPPGALEALTRTGPAVIARYRLKNRGTLAARVTLDLALRPYQVNPPQQFLNTRGGSAPMDRVERDGLVVRVNGDRSVVLLAPPTSFAAGAGDEGEASERLRTGKLPARRAVADPSGRAWAVASWALELPPGGSREVDVLVPLRGATLAPAGPVDTALVALAMRRAADDWERRLAGVTIELPPAYSEVARTLRAQLGWILVNRDGPAIQPGSRSYERSWIRDGALTSAALLRTGHARPVREFLEWFAARQYPSGKVPCCVDARGADPVPEHDSSGELIFAIAEYTRLTGERDLAERLWPSVEGAAAYLDSLRKLRRTAEWRAADKREFFGLLPPSISHEGYSAKPMHSYWDDLFALRGFKDAAWLAGVLGRSASRKRWSAARDEFQRDLVASVKLAAAKHKIDYMPGCADLGDFDATSTTIALDPASADRVLPRELLEGTFQKYQQSLRDRRDGSENWDAMTPYEIRNIGAFVRLGQRQNAQGALAWFLSLRRPNGWAQWPEVVRQNLRKPEFLGDLPHTWVGSDYVRSVLDLFAYPTEDSALVIGAGVSTEWVSVAPGVSVRGLRTPFGALSYSMQAAGDSIVVQIEAGVRPPKGGIVVRAPGGPRRAWLNGAAVAVKPDGDLVVRRVPARVVLTP